jgi:hypothetical protein
MRLRTLPALTLVLLSIHFSKAQKLDFGVKWGKEFDASRKSSLSDIVGYDATGIYAVKVQDKVRGWFKVPVYSLDKYDPNLNFSKSNEIEIQENGKDCEVSYFLHLKGKLYVFYSFLDNKNKKKLLFVDEIDKGTLQLKGNKRKVGEIDFSGNSKRNSGSFSFRVSRDSSKVLVYYSLPDTKGDPEAFGFNVLDNTLTSLWEKNVTLPFKDGLFDIESIRVDNDGNTYLMGILFKDKHKEKRKGAPNYTYEAFAYTNNGAGFKQYTISIPDKFITDMQFEISNGQLFCAGFYSQKGTLSIRGTFFLTADIATAQINVKSFKEFGIDFIAQGLSKRQEKKAKKKDAKGEDPELYSYALDRLLIGKDGSIVLIGEQYYVHVVTKTSSMNGVPQSSTMYYYHYNDIIAVKIDPAGQILWTSKISKTQISTNDEGFYSSYTLAIVEGKICFIYNDSPENLDYDGKGRPDNFKIKKSLAVIVSLDANGDQTKQPIFATADVDVTLRPKVCEQISNHDVILFGQRRKNQQFARLQFK